jgi:hypothetical protein
VVKKWKMGREAGELLGKVKEGARRKGREEVSEGKEIKGKGKFWR